MKNDVLSSINDIEVSAAETEVYVVEAVNEVGEKYASVLEHCDADTDTDLFVVQEGAIGDEMKAMKKEGESSVETALKAIPRFIAALIKVIKAKFGKDKQKKLTPEEQEKVHNVVDEILDDSEKNSKLKSDIVKTAAAVGLAVTVVGTRIHFKRKKQKEVSEFAAIPYDVDITFERDENHNIFVTTNIDPHELSERLEELTQRLADLSARNDVSHLLSNISKLDLSYFKEYPSKAVCDPPKKIKYKDFMDSFNTLKDLSPKYDDAFEKANDMLNTGIKTLSKDKITVSSTDVKKKMHYLVSVMNWNSVFIKDIDFTLNTMAKARAKTSGLTRTDTIHPVGRTDLK